MVQPGSAGVGWEGGKAKEYKAGVSWRATAVMGAGALPWQALGAERCR